MIHYQDFELADLNSEPVGSESVPVQMDAENAVASITRT